MKFTLKPILPAAMLLCACACNNTPATSPAQATLLRLAAATADGTFLYGHQDDMSYGKLWRVEDPANDPLDRSDVYGVCGQYPAIVGFDLGGIELGNDANLDGVPFELMRRAVAIQTQRGGLVTFSWHARNPLTGGDSWDIATPGVVESILEGGENHEKFLVWLDRTAAFLKSLGGVPIIFRPWHENIGRWFWWGAPHCTVEQYKALWVLTWEKLKDVPNLLWAYSPNPDYSQEQCSARYAGDEYVDIIGFDTYGNAAAPDPKADYTAKMQKGLAYVSAFAKEHGKIYCVSETGYEGIPDPTWWTGTLLPSMEGYSPSYILTWRNAWDRPTHYYSAYPGSLDAADFQAFAKSSKTIMLD